MEFCLLILEEKLIYLLNHMGFLIITLIFVINHVSHRKSFLKNLKVDNAYLKVNYAKYPSDTDWQEVFVKLKQMTASFSANLLTDSIHNLCTISISNLPHNADGQYNNKNKSYTFQCVSPIHKNEKQNFITKSAAYNLNKYTEATNDSVNFMIIHLPINAPIRDFEEWAEEYLKEDITRPISGVIFYQPCWIPYENNTHVLSNFISVVYGTKYSDWLAKFGDSKFEFFLPVGVKAEKPHIFVHGSSQSQVNLDSKYIYQSGEHYVDAKVTENKTQGHAKHLSYNIYQNAVLPMKDRDIIIKGRFANELTIL